MIKFNGVNKWFGKLHVLKDIDLHVTSGEVVVVCGPSGSGKSTLIRCINRLETHEKGTILVNGEEVKGKGGAAELLQLHPNTLRFRMRKLGIERPNGHTRRTHT